MEHNITTLPATPKVKWWMRLDPAFILALSTFPMMSIAIAYKETVPLILNAILLAVSMPFVNRNTFAAFTLRDEVLDKIFAVDSNPLGRNDFPSYEEFMEYTNKRLKNKLKMLEAFNDFSFDDTIAVCRWHKSKEKRLSYFHPSIRNLFNNKEV